MADTPSYQELEASRDEWKRIAEEAKRETQRWKDEAMHLRGYRNSTEDKLRNEGSAAAHFATIAMLVEKIEDMARDAGIDAGAR